jgi:hypothetical protein
VSRPVVGSWTSSGAAGVAIEAVLGTSGAPTWTTTAGALGGAAPAALLLGTTGVLAAVVVGAVVVVVLEDGVVVVVVLEHGVGERDQDADDGSGADAWRC